MESVEHVRHHHSRRAWACAYPLPRAFLLSRWILGLSWACLDRFGGIGYFPDLLLPNGTVTILKNRENGQDASLLYQLLL